MIQRITPSLAQAADAPSAAPIPTPLHIPTADRLVSPHAPTWTDKLVDFFQWIWGYIRPLFFFLPAPQIQPPPARPIAPQKPGILPMAISTAINRGLIPWGLAKLLGQPDILTLSLANLAYETTTFALDYTAKTAFPKDSPLLIRGVSMLVASRVVWVHAEQLGYPLGNMYLVTVAMGFFRLAQNPFAQMNLQTRS